MAIAFNINTGSNAPIYQQITAQVRLAVAAGKLAVGDQLPSVRGLCAIVVKMLRNPTKTKAIARSP